MPVTPLIAATRYRHKGWILGAAVIDVHRDLTSAYSAFRALRALAQPGDQGAQIMQLTDESAEGGAASDRRTLCVPN